MHILQFLNVYNFFSNEDAEMPLAEVWSDLKKGTTLTYY